MVALCALLAYALLTPARLGHGQYSLVNLLAVLGALALALTGMLARSARVDALVQRGDWLRWLFGLVLAAQFVRLFWPTGHYAVGLVLLALGIVGFGYFRRPPLLPPRWCFPALLVVHALLGAHV